MSRIVTNICVIMAVFGTAYTQCINRVLPGLQPGLMPFAETMLPNQLLYNQVPNYIPATSYDYGYETVYPAPSPVMPTTTIIQDSTVSNNLANALQLLVVSNLLSNTLPVANEVVVPSYEYGNGLLSSVGPVSPCSSYGGYNYIY